MTLQTGQIKQRQYPSTCVLIKHEQAGYILFDTGYSDSFFSMTKRFPYSLYRYITPVTLQKSLKNQLIEQGIKPEEISYIIISHFHSDHIAGLADFPNARFICHPEALEDIRHKNRFKALLEAFLPGLLPKDFYERTLLCTDKPIILDHSLHPFTSGFDLFGDQQLIAIPLPGHAKGHIGLYLNGEQKVFLVADSCWHQDAFKEGILPSNLTYLIHDNKEEYIQTIRNLHTLYQHNKSIQILPTHCLHTRELVGDLITC